MKPTGIIPKWEILYGEGDVAVYNGLKIFHVYPEEAEMVVKILNELEDELARCKEDMLGNVQSELYQNNILRSYPEEMHSYRKTKEGKG